MRWPVPARRWSPVDCRLRCGSRWRRISSRSPTPSRQRRCWSAMPMELARSDRRIPNRRRQRGRTIAASTTWTRHTGARAARPIRQPCSAASTCWSRRRWRSLPSKPAPSAWTRSTDARSIRHLGWSPFSWPINLAGLPAATIPCGFDADGLPIGLQIVAPWLDEAVIFRIAAAFEAARPWANVRPA